jgi:pimeloyl-ACP methyl ester carboxylesterase
MEPTFAAGIARTWQTPDGLTLFARDYAAAAGEARLPVICLHGLTRNSLDFEDLAPWIAAQGRRVIAMDMRGRGLSANDPQPARYQPKTYAADVLGFMDALGIARAVFIGTSMGGIITMAIAAKRDGAIAAAVLNDVGPVLSPVGLQRIAGYVGKSAPVASWNEAAARIRSINAVAFPHNSDAEWLRWAQRAFRQQDDGSFISTYDPAIALPFQGTHIAPNWFKTLIAKLLFKRLAKRRPTLLVRGGISDLIGADEVGWMQAAAPQLQVAEVPGIGHAPMLNEPEAQAALTEFLRTLP